MSHPQSEVESILIAIQQLDDTTKRFLVQEIQAMVMRKDDSASEYWTDEELGRLIDPKPMTGAEAIAAGLTGTWKHEGIEDSVEWLNQQRETRRKKNLW